MSESFSFYEIPPQVLETLDLDENNPYKDFSLC